MKHAFRYIILLLLVNVNGGVAQTPTYRVFETEVVNTTNYSNKYTDVELNVQYQAPSGKVYNFFGFYDGDGDGGAEGTVWKLRFMPNEVGKWKFVYTWSDSTKRGKGSFKCVAEDAGKGVLKAYSKNPHWLAYNGSEPVWLKSYYETGHGSLGQDFDWVQHNVYDTLIKNGYNHLQVNWLLSLCCSEQFYKDGPEPETLDLLLYKEGDIYGTMNHNVWKRMEKHLAYLNDNDVGVHMFLGVDGSKNDGPDWAKLSYTEKDFFVKYMVARLAPFANIAGWNYVWEVPGSREKAELGFARLIQKYDIFNHLCTYEDEFPRENEYNRVEYSFAAVENHEIVAPDRNMDRTYWKEPFTHHIACLLGYQGKPVFMTEGNALWRRFWEKRTMATQDDLRRSAWACATAGASFTWCGHAGEEALFVSGPEGLPFNSENEYQQSEKYISILTDVMRREVTFYAMKPNDKLLSNHPSTDVYALAEIGHQYLVFSARGTSFNLDVSRGNYAYVKWIDSKTGVSEELEGFTVTESTKNISFIPPSQTTDWVLIVRK